MRFFKLILTWPRRATTWVIGEVKNVISFSPYAKDSKLPVKDLLIP